MNRLAVNLSMALLVALGLLACDNDEKPTGPNQPAPASPVTAHPPALVSPHSGPSQLPEPGDIALPGLLPGPSGSALPRPALDLTDLEQATEVVWGSILGTEPSDPVVAQLLADVPVLMSGIRQIKGRTYLYLGIGRAYFNRHGGEHIYNTLTKRFPTVPLYIEPSDGVRPLSATLAAPQAASPTDTPASVAPAGKAVATVDAPAAPTNLRVEALTDTSAQVRWDAVAGATDYDVNYKPAVGGRWTNEPHRGVGLSNTIDDLAPNTEYRWAVRAENRDGASAWIHGPNFTTRGAPARGAPASPTNLRITDLTETSVRLHWDAVAGATDYDVNYKKAEGGRWTNEPHEGTTLYSALTGLEPNTEYRWAVRAENRDGPSDWVFGARFTTIAEGPNLTVASVTASPSSVASGDGVTVRATIRNDGNASASSETVRVYRHRSATTDPTSGTLVGSATTGTLAAGASTTASVRITAPTVTEQTTYYYYVCTDDACASDQVIVTPKEVTKTPEVMGGDAISAYYKFSTRGLPGTKKDPFRNPVWAGTLTLGGLTTTDGTRGFVISGHSAVDGPDHLEGFTAGATDALIFGDFKFDERTGTNRTFLGKVMQLPRPHTKGHRSEFIYADAAFVAYPSTVTSDCSLTWTTGDYTDTNRTFCLDLGKGDQVETVPPLAIRGKFNATYNVVGSTAPTMGLDVMFSGSTSGVAQEGNRITSGAMLSSVQSGFQGRQYLYFIDGGQESQGGDSGAPIYTVPDRNGNVRIVGILTGGATLAGEKVTLFNSWDDVEKELDLQPIQ